MSVTALGLLKFVPQLVGAFGGSKAKEVVEIVTDIGKQITGKEQAGDVEAVLANDPDLAYQFQLAVMENETVLERMDEDSRARASGQYQVNPDQADKVAQSIMNKNLNTVFLLVLLNGLAVILANQWDVEGHGQIAIISNLIGVVCGQLLNERQSVVSFFFGSSLGSKLKNVLNKP